MKAAGERTKASERPRPASSLLMGLPARATAIGARSPCGECCAAGSPPTACGARQHHLTLSSAQLLPSGSDMLQTLTVVALGW